MDNKKLANMLRDLADYVEGNHSVRVVSDDWCIGVLKITDIRWNPDRDRYEIVCNQ